MGSITRISRSIEQYKAKIQYNKISIGCNSGDRSSTTNFYEKVVGVFIVFVFVVFATYFSQLLTFLFQLLEEGLDWMMKGQYMF